MNTRPAALLLTAAFVAHTASAAITGVSGQTTWLFASPASCASNALTGFNAFAWDEQQNVPLVNTFVDMTNNPGNSGGPIPGLLNGSFDSHFIHFQGIPGVISAQGSVTFNGTIVGVAFKNTTLDVTDPLVGAFGTVYPTGYPFRGINTSIPSFFSISGNTINFNLAALASVGEVAQLRVFTQVPSPGPVALLGLGGLVAIRRRR
ncbi:MAG: hypothetical protein K2Y21_06095 [Phycisphaerales bacterium]|nr:hypothetical protein [Phycisphaerales bacterium]